MNLLRDQSPENIESLAFVRQTHRVLHKLKFYLYVVLSIINISQTARENNSVIVKNGLNAKIETFLTVTVCHREANDDGSFKKKSRSLLHYLTT